MGTKTLMARSSPMSAMQNSTSPCSRWLPFGHMYGTSSRSFLRKSFQVEVVLLVSGRSG